MSHDRDGPINRVPAFRELLRVFPAQMTTPTFRNFSQIAAGWLFAARLTRSTLARPLMA